MKPIIAEHEGVRFTINSIEINKEFNCKADCYSEDQYSCFKKECSLTVSASKAIATEVSISILNASDNSIQIPPKLWEMIDTNGFSYNGLSICNELWPPRIKGVNDIISPKTRARMILIFPELEKGIDVSALLIGYEILRGGMFRTQRTDACRLEINPLTNEASELFSKNTDFICMSSISRPVICKIAAFSMRSCFSRTKMLSTAPIIPVEPDTILNGSESGAFRR